MKKKLLIAQSGVALSRCPIFLWMAPGKFQASSPQASEKYQASKIQFHAQELLELGIWNFSGARVRHSRGGDGGWFLEFGAFPRSCKSLILLMIANNCRKLLGEKNYFMPQSKIRPGAASKELQTRALLKKLKPPIESEMETPAETQARLFHRNHRRTDSNLFQSIRPEANAGAGGKGSRGRSPHQISDFLSVAALPKADGLWTLGVEMARQMGNRETRRRDAGAPGDWSRTNV